MKKISIFEWVLHIILLAVTNFGWTIFLLIRIFFVYKNSRKNTSLHGQIMNKVDDINSKQSLKNKAGSQIGKYSKRILDLENEEAENAAIDDDWYEFAEEYSFELVGESYKRKELISIIKSHDAMATGELLIEAVLKMEPSDFDQTAVAVYIDNKPVGFVPASLSMNVTDYINDLDLTGIEVKARIGWDAENPDPAIGVRIDFNF